MQTAPFQMIGDLVQHQVVLNQYIYIYTAGFHPLKRHPTKAHLSPRDCLVTAFGFFFFKYFSCRCGMSFTATQHQSRVQTCVNVRDALLAWMWMSHTRPPPPFTPLRLRSRALASAVYSVVVGSWFFFALHLQRLYRGCLCLVRFTFWSYSAYAPSRDGWGGNAGIWTPRTRRKSSQWFYVVLWSC